MTLRIYLDEDVHTRLALLLQSEGFDAITALDAGQAHRRIPDEQQLIYAASAGRAICTYNVKDYSPLAIKWAQTGREHAGIILMHRRPLGVLVARFHAFASRYPDGTTNICDFL